MRSPADAHREFSPDELDRIKDQAVIEAHRLRHEAIDDFWRGVSGLLSTATIRTYRSAQRLASRLRRRVRRDESQADPASAD